jgi:hypothetical protein
MATTFILSGSITAVDVNQEVLLQVSAQPIKENRIAVFLQRAKSYKNVPITSDKKHCSDKGYFRLDYILF